jgi:hypothetical protein
MASDRTGVIYTYEKMNLNDLQNLLRSGPKWVYVSRLDEARIIQCTIDLPEHWSYGRAFCTEREVRWQKASDHYRVDVLTEDSDAFSSNEGWKRTASGIDGLRKRTILLWGELGEHLDSPEEWIEMRIPQPLHYPVGDLQRPVDLQTQRALLRVVIRGYDYTVGHIPVTTRWAVLEQDQPMPSSAQEA